MAKVKFLVSILGKNVGDVEEMDVESGLGKSLVAAEAVEISDKTTRKTKPKSIGDKE